MLLFGVTLSVFFPLSRTMDTNHSMFLDEYKTFSDFPDDSVFVITKAEMKDTVNGSMGFLEYSQRDAKGKCDTGMLMVPKRFMDSSPDTLSTPYIIVYRGKRETPGAVNWFYDVRLVVLSADEKKDVESKATAIRRMSKIQRDAYFRHQITHILRSRKCGYLYESKNAPLRQQHSGVCCCL